MTSTKPDTGNDMEDNTVTVSWMELNTEQEKVLEKNFSDVLDQIKLIKNPGEPCVRCEIAKRSKKESAGVCLEKWLQNAPSLSLCSSINIKELVTGCDGIIHPENGSLCEENSRLLGPEEVEQISKSIHKLPSEGNVPECLITFTNNKTKPIASVKRLQKYFVHALRVKEVAKSYEITGFNIESFGGITPAHINHDINMDQSIIVCKFTGKYSKHISDCPEGCIDDHEPNWVFVDGIHRFYRSLQDKTDIRAFVISVDQTLKPKLESCTISDGNASKRKGRSNSIDASNCKKRKVVHE